MIKIFTDVICFFTVSIVYLVLDRIENKNTLINMLKIISGVLVIGFSLLSIIELILLLIGALEL